jgi:hypothetical protein
MLAGHDHEVVVALLKRLGVEVADWDFTMAMCNYFAEERRKLESDRGSSADTVGVYRYAESFGSHGDLASVFLATAGDIAAAMGKTAYLGEVLGKRSEVTATIDADTVTLATADPAVVEVVRALGLETGINPLDYIEDEES